MDIFSLIILFFVISTVVRLIKKAKTVVQKPSTMAQTQLETAAQKHAPEPPPRPAPKSEDFRFPSMPKPAPKPVLQEGPDRSTVMGEYTPINSSSDLNQQFSAYEGSLDVDDETEGVGYEAETYDDTAAPGQLEPSDLQILPETFNRNALLQAVVMSEVLKRPGARR